MSCRKKIIIVTNNLYGGGAEKVLDTLVSNLNKNKYDITILTLHKVDLIPNTFQDVKIKHIFIHDSIFSKINNKIALILYNKFPKVFYRVFIRKKYDIEIAFIEGYATKIVANSFNRTSKKYAWVHIDLLTTPWSEICYRNNLEEKECYQNFHKILCVSKSVKDNFINKFHLDKNVFVQYNPIDEKNIYNKSNEFKINKNDIFNFVTIGRLESQKGYERLLNIVNRLKSEGFLFHLTILGEGTLKSKLETKIKREKLDQYVSLVGYQSNPYPYIIAADAYICSSISEGYSTTVIESIILNTPILTTNCAGMTEIFGQYKCGIICENNEQAVYAMIKDVLINSESLNYFKQEIEKRKSFFKLSNRIIEIERLLDEPFN